MIADGTLSKSKGRYPVVSVARRPDRGAAGSAGSGRRSLRPPVTSSATTPPGGSATIPGWRPKLGLLACAMARSAPPPACATAYQEQTDPRAGELSVILDGDGEPLCVIRTTSIVETRRFTMWTRSSRRTQARATAASRTGARPTSGSSRPQILAEDDTEVVLERFDLLLAVAGRRLIRHRFATVRPP